MTGVPHIEGRWWGSTSASIAAHAALVALLLLIAARAADISKRLPQPVDPNGLIFLPSGGIGGGGGGGGDDIAQQPRPVQVRPTPPAQMPTPSDAVQPPASVPVVSLTTVETVPGAPIDAALTTAPGKGDGPGGGGGRGSGNGPNNGTGLGDGPLAGFGGDVYLPGNGVSNPVLVREVKPNYTSDAMRAKVQGTVEMEAVVLADGTIDPKSIRIVRSLDPAFGLDREAVAAVKQWRFNPAMRKGKPVAVLVTLELGFTLR